MRTEAPTGRAVATYCADWPNSCIDRPGLARVNPETLGNATSPDFAFQYIDISSVAGGTIDWRPLLMSNAFLKSLDQVSTVCSTGFAVIRSDGGLQPNFLKHLPFAEQVTRQLVAWQCGTNYPAVNERDVRGLVVPVPPPAEQAAIARILDAVDTALERTRAAVERARQLRTSLLQASFEFVGSAESRRILTLAAFRVHGMP
jgi:type I restriction enzyme, S subunit